MAFKLDDESKKIVNSTSSNSQSNSSGKSSNKTTSGFKLNDESKTIVNSSYNSVAPKTFTSFGGVYRSNGVGGYVKTGYQKKQSEKDKEKQLQTGHETLGTDVKQAAESGGRSWLSSHLSTIATVGLGIEAAKNKDNNYQPDAGSWLWRTLNASSVNTAEANELLQNAQEGRSGVGKTAMTVTNSMVQNGIDAAIKSIPYVGSVLGTVSFASRGFGSTAQQKRDEGKSVGTQVLSGAISAAIEAVTEGMSEFGGVRNYLGESGTGWLDTAYKGLESVLAKKFGKVAAKMAVTMGSEAVEEMAADVLNPIVGSVVENFTENSKAFSDFEGEEWQGIGNMLYDGLIGALSAIGGGIVTSAQTGINYSGMDNQLYSTMLRQEYQANRFGRQEEGRAHRQSIFDAVDALFNKETGQTLQERATQAAGRYTSRKEAGKLLAQRDADFMKVVEQIADKFAEQSFANEVVDKEILKNAVIRFFATGEFAEELDSINESKAQIQTIAKDIMAEYAQQKLDEAKSKKDKAKTAFYTSLVSKLVNEAFNETTTASFDDVDVTEAKTYRNTEEEIEADRRRRYGEAEPVTQTAQQQGVDISQEDYAYIKEHNPELWAEYEKAFADQPLDSHVLGNRAQVNGKIISYLRSEGRLNTQNAEAKAEAPKAERKESTLKTAEEIANTGAQKRATELVDYAIEKGKPIHIEYSKTISAENQALVDAIIADANSKGYTAQKEYLSDTNETVVALSEAEQVQEHVETEQTEEEPKTLTKNDKQKINRLFKGKQKSVKIDGNSALLEAIRQKAEAEGKVITVEDGKVKFVEKAEQRTQETAVEEQQEVAEEAQAVEESLEEEVVPVEEAPIEEETSAEAPVEEKPVEQPTQKPKVEIKPEVKQQQSELDKLKAKEEQATGQEIKETTKELAAQKETGINAEPEQKNISSFSGEYDFLSNKYKSEIYFSRFDKTFNSVSDALKDKQVKAAFTEAQVVAMKFQQNAELRGKLFALKDATFDSGTNLDTILPEVINSLSAEDSVYNDVLPYTEAAKSGSFMSELNALNEIEAKNEEKAQEKKNILLSKFTGGTTNEQSKSSSRSERRMDNVGESGHERPTVRRENEKYKGELPSWVLRGDAENASSDEDGRVEQRTPYLEGRAVMPSSQNKLISDGDYVYGYHAYRIVSALRGTVADYVNNLAEKFGNKNRLILVGGEGGIVRAGSLTSSTNGLSDGRNIAVGVDDGKNAVKAIGTYLHENNHDRLRNSNQLKGKNFVQQSHLVHNWLERSFKSAGFNLGTLKAIQTAYYVKSYKNVFEADGTANEYRKQARFGAKSFEDSILEGCSEEIICDFIGMTSNVKTIMDALDLSTEDVTAIRNAILQELASAGIYTEEDVSIINQALDDAKAKDFVGVSDKYGNINKYYELVDGGNAVSYSSGNQNVAKASEEIPSLNEFRKQRGETKRNIYETNEERAITAKDEENLNLSDAEYYERRQADKSIPSIQDFEREKNQQPKAESKMSPSEAKEMAERSFGEKGRIRATRVVERFRRLGDTLKNVGKAIDETKAARIQGALGKMFNKLIDVNDGYGTVKEIADMYRGWRDNKDVSDYYDDETAARFDKILEDAEAKGWTFEPQDQREFAQAYEEACNAMIARINNVNKDVDRQARLQAEAIANKKGWKADSLPAKALQKWLRMQATTDTALKFFGGFKGSGEFYNLSKDIKDSVARRMVTFVDAYSHFDALKQMEGFKEFSSNKKTYPIEFNSNFAHHKNPLAGHEFTLQQIVTMNRLFKTLDKTFEHSDAKAAERIKGFVFRDAKGNSFTVDLGDFSEDTETKASMKQTSTIAAIQTACMDILGREGAVFDVAREYDKAADKMFKALGKKVSDVRKVLTGNALSLIGEDYTPVLWANEDGTPADFNFNDDDRIKPPSFLYNRTAKQGYLVVSDISYIVDKYIEKASDYVGTAQIKDTLARMNDGTSLLDNGKGLNSALAENFGKEAGSWFDEYVKDLTEYGENDSIWATLRRNMQKGALIGSPSVMMKQTSSYWSAMGLLSPEALAMAYRWKIGVKAADNSEFNPLLKYRNISDKFDPTLSEIIQDISKYGKVADSRVFKLFTNGISAQDYKTVDNLYTATMIDTYLRNQNKGAEYFTSGEFQSDIDSKFTEVMMRSQPMFDTELRAEYARTDKELVKMTSMFRTQQTQNLNLIATAIGEYNASKGTGNQAEKLKVLQQTVAGQASAALSLALLSVAADFMLHGLKKYRGDGDDEDEEPGDGKIELGRILGRIGLNAVETGAGTAWFGDSVAKWLIDRMSGGETNEFYSFNMGPLSTIKSVIDNLEYAAKSPTPSNIKNVATNVAQLLGIPLNNAYRYVNSAVMYAHTLSGNNDKKYDDMLKMWGGAAKVADKNIKGRNLLVESGMSKKEANAFVRLVDEDGNGLNKDDLTNWYVDHPEDGDKVSILWDSMGWKQTFAKAKKSLDKKVVYNSNPLFAEMDEDESESVTKAELMNYYIDHPEIRDDLEKMYTDLGFKDFKSAVKSADKKIKFRSNPLYAEMDEDENESVSKSELTAYAIEHPEMYDTLAPLYKELGFKGTFRSAIRSAESTKIKEAAEDAFYDGDYNALFESVSQMKNGKTWLTNMVKDEYPDYENMENPLLHYLTDSGLSTKQIDTAVESFGGKKLIPQYKKLRESGLSPKQAVERLDLFDANDNGSITQTELADYYKAHPEEEAIIAEFWTACGWSKTWAQYKKSKKIK